VKQLRQVKEINKLQSERNLAEIKLQHLGEMTSIKSKMEESNQQNDDEISEYRTRMQESDESLTDLILTLESFNASLDSARATNLASLTPDLDERSRRIKSNELIQSLFASIGHALQGSRYVGVTSESVTL